MSSPLGLSALVPKTTPVAVTSLRATKRTDGAPSGPTVARLAARASGMSAVTAAATQLRSGAAGSAGGSSGSGWSPGVPRGAPVTGPLVVSRLVRPTIGDRRAAPRDGRCPRHYIGANDGQAAPVAD